MNAPGKTYSASYESLKESAEILGHRYDSNGNPRTDEDTPLIFFVLGAKAAPGMMEWKSDDARRASIHKEVLFFGRDKFGGLKEFANEIWEEYGYLIGPRPRHLQAGDLLRKVEPEIMCSVLAKVGLWRRDVQELICDAYNKPPSSLLAYELTAHGVKHRFIDHVISMNFDSFLDDAIYDEVADENYQLIYSDVQATPRLDDDIACIFKLHGSTRFPDTMKFSHASTGGMYPEVAESIDRLISKAQNRPLYIFSYGYAWRDPDMLNWLKAVGPSIKGMFVALGNRSKEQFCQDLSLGEDDRHLVDAIRTIATSELKLGKKSLSAGELMWVQLEMSRAHYPSVFHVPIARHLLVSHLQNDKRRPNDFDRAKLEIVMHFEKSKGMVVANNLVNEHRFNKFYAPFNERKKLRFQNWLGPLTKYQNEELREVYYERKTTKWWEQLTLGNSPVYDLEFDHNWSNPRFRRRSQSRFYQDHLQIIRGMPDTEVGPVPKTSTSWMFLDPNPIRTFVELKSATSSLINANWSNLLAIAESASWVSDYGAKRSQALSVIVADVSQEWHWGKQDEKRIEADLAKLNFERIHMPWFLHNQHLTLVVNCDSGTLNEEHMSGVYFRRPYKSKQINPVSVTGSDCIELLIVFVAYLTRTLERSKIPETTWQQTYKNVRAISDQVLAADRSFRSKRNRDQRLRSALGRLDDQAQKQNLATF